LGKISPFKLIFCEKSPIFAGSIFISYKFFFKMNDVKILAFILIFCFRDESFQVIDYCARNLVQVSNPEDGPKQLPVRGGELQGRNLLLLTLLQNHENRTVEMVLSCAYESDRQRWLSAFAPPVQPENPEERVYEEWDCPQVQAVHAYTARQPDELSLEVADVVNVMRKLPDGEPQ
jgi:neuronal guanine nucleotide exchange factor